jgi:hypothetical protein
MKKRHGKKPTISGAGPPDTSIDRDALEDERLRTIAEDRDEDFEAVGFNNGMKRLAAVLRKIKEAGNEERT